MLGFRRRVLLIGNEGVVLFGPSPSGGGVEREVSVAWSVPDFTDQLVAALKKKNAKNAVTILFDGSDNAFRKEDNVPKLSAVDRGKYIKRKLDQVFASYPIRAFMEIKDKDRAKEKLPPSYLFVAITETENIDKVIDCMFEAAVPVAGFGVLPIESDAMVAALAKQLFVKEPKKEKKKKAKEEVPEEEMPDNGKVGASKWAVLIGQHETGGLRQVIVKNGKMALTRLTPVSEAGTHGEAWVDEVVTEFTATQTYLTRLGYRHDEGLDVMVVSSEQDKAFFESKGFNPGDNFACLTPGEALELLGFKKNILGDIGFGDALYGAWISKQKFLNLPLKIPALMNILWPRLAARLGAVFLVLLSIAIAGYNFHTFQKYTGVKEQIAQKERQEALLKKEYAQEAKVFDTFPLELDLVKNTLAITDDLDSKVFRITPMLNILKKVLPNDIKLYGLDMEYTPKPDNTRRNSRRRGRGAPAASNTQESKRGTVEITIQFALLRQLPLEEKVIRAEQIVNELSRDLKGYEVELDSQFGNVSRSGGFSGTSDEGEEEGGRISDAIGSEELATVIIKGPAP